MYSRNSQTYRDDYTDVSEEEYELYKYNLPPKYDGSRFRNKREQRRREILHPEDEIQQVNDVIPDLFEPDLLDTDRADYKNSETYDEHLDEGDERSETGKDDNVKNSHEEAQAGGKVKEERGVFDSILRHIGDKFGGEELLIISLILIFAGDKGAEDAGDIVLLLALLLIAG